MVAALDAEYGPQRSSIDMAHYVADDAALREASVAADKELSNFDVEQRYEFGHLFFIFVFHFLHCLFQSSMRKDVFNVIAAVENCKELMDSYDAETQRFVHRMVINGKRSGK